MIAVAVQISWSIGGPRAESIICLASIFNISAAAAVRINKGTADKQHLQFTYNTSSIVPKADQFSAEAEFLDVIGTKILIVFFLGIYIYTHRHY
jgi:hypothetical protein